MENKKQWKHYIDSLEQANNMEVESKWNKHRELIMRDDRKKKQILLKEIKKNNCDVYFYS
jgi:hypothetical protein